MVGKVGRVCWFLGGLVSKYQIFKERFNVFVGWGGTNQHWTPIGQKDLGVFWVFSCFANDFYRYLGVLIIPK